MASELQIDRETVARYLKLYQNGAKPATAPPGSADPNPATFPGPPGSEPGGLPLAEQSESATDSNPATAPLGSDGCGSSPFATPPAPTERGAASHCEPFREIILAKLQQGLTAQRIYQDLATEHAYEGSYYSVKRFVRRLGRQVELPMRRMECAAGEEAQVDFGTGAPLVGLDGKRRKTNVFRVVLSHSRKAYSEATCRQTTEDFIRCLENAFWYFGGVPKILVIDNLRAAVSRPDWFDPELNPKLQSFCQHYGTVILPTKPRMPRHKGKIERGIGYVKGNGLKARQFGSVEAQNQHLLEWEATVADTGQGRGRRRFPQENGELSAHVRVAVSRYATCGKDETPEALALGVLSKPDGRRKVRKPKKPPRNRPSSKQYSLFRKPQSVVEQRLREFEAVSVAKTKPTLFEPLCSGVNGVSMLPEQQLSIRLPQSENGCLPGSQIQKEPFSELQIVTIPLVTGGTELILQLPFLPGEV